MTSVINDSGLAFKSEQKQKNSNLFGPNGLKSVDIL